MLPTITIDGRLVGDPELRFTPAGRAVCNLRVAASDSRKLDDGGYETTEQIFVNVAIWEEAAEAAAEAYAKGDRVLVTGRLYQRAYETRDGAKSWSLELKFPVIASVAKTSSATSSTGRPHPNSATPANDPWASAGGGDEPPF